MRAAVVVRQVNQPIAMDGVDGAFAQLETGQTALNVVVFE